MSELLGSERPTFVRRHGRLCRRQHGTLTLALVAGAALALAGRAAGSVAPSAVAQEPTPEPYRVAITTHGVSPAVIAVPAGRTVLWVNETTALHNATHLPEVGQPVIWNSGDIAPEGGEFHWTFEAVGTYHYIDLLYPDDVAFQGTVLVTDNEPTATPLVATAGPTPTDGPTATRRPPTATVPPSPTPVEPTRAPVVVLGRLLPADVPECSVDAAVRPCGQPGSLVYVRTDGVIDRALFGRDVRLEGVLAECDAAGLTYLWLSQASELPGGCNQPTATPSPSPTLTPTDPLGTNFARGRPVTAKGPDLPGYEPDLLTDGSSSTFWYSDHQDTWAYVDLGESRTFNQVRLKWSSPYAERYGVYVWEEGAWRGRLVVDNARGGEDVRTLTFTEARYVLLYLMRSSSPGGGFALGEWEVYGEERPNWALGQPVVASSDQGGQVAAYSNDGLMGTFWVSAPGDANPWLAVYLPSTVELTEFRLWWTTAYPPYYSLVFFEAGRRTLYSPVQVDHAGLHRLVGRVPVRADTVMVYAHQNAPAGYVGLQELEILGPGPGAAEDSVPLWPEGVDAWLQYGRLPFERTISDAPTGSAARPGPRLVQDLRVPVR